MERSRAAAVGAATPAIPLYLGFSRAEVKVSLSDRYAGTEIGPAATPAWTTRTLTGIGDSFGAFRHRNFRIFFVGHLLSLSGTWLQITALGWLVLELTNSEFWLGVVNAGTSVPILFFSLYAGVIADRVDKRWILIAAQAVMFFQALTLAVLTHLEVITIGWILALVLVLGVANAFEIPTRQSFFVELVGQQDLTNAIALNSSAFNATRMVGPAIAGGLIGAFGIAACFYGNAISYFFVIAGLMAIRRPSPEPAPRTLSTLENIREGFAWIWNERVPRLVVVFVATASVLVFPFTMLLPVFARDLLRIGPQGLGWLYSATGAGALIAGLTVTAISQRVPRGRLLVASGAAMSVFVAAFALTPSFLLSLLFLAATGFAMILSTATANSLLQSLVPNHLRGRVMSVYVVMFLGVTPFGYLLAGSLAGIFGARATLAAGAGILFTILLTQFWRSPRLREAV
ncbi:MAG TPA: MFS transporter [Longimicrobiaceae bacterium]|nr:MFS transporter [Longimicrobiaceae bacterium]